jgi:hypothetical protein
MKVTGQLQAPITLPLEKGPWVLHRRLCGYHSWSGCREEETNLLHLPRIVSGSLARILVVARTEHFFPFCSYILKYQIAFILISPPSYHFSVSLPLATEIYSFISFISGSTALCWALTSSSVP